MILTQDALDYLKEVKQNNSKEWYEANKERYNDSLMSPLKELVVQLTDTMLAIDPEFQVEPRVDRTISRLYRDTRFSKDKSLYKDRTWITFKKKGQSNVDYPAFFFEISPYGFFYGMGFYGASVATMTAIREKIDADERMFLQLVDDTRYQGIFLPEGEMYKKNRYHGQNEQIAEWYNRKNLYLIHHSKNVNELFSENFACRLKEGFVALSGFYHFFVQALHEQWLRDEGFEKS